VNNDSKLKRDEFYKVLKENEVIRMEMNELQEALKKVSEIAINYENTINVQQGHENELKEAIQEQTIEISQLHVKLDQIGREKKILEAKLIEMDERENDVDNLVREFKLRHEMEKASLVSQLEEAKRALLISSSNSFSSKNSPTKQIDFSKEELEKQLTKLEELRLEDKATIAELEHQLEQREEDLKSVMEQVDVDQLIQKAVEKAIEKEQKTNQEIMKESKRLKKRVQEQSEMMREMEKHTSEIEQHLLEAQNWNAKYEAKAGLEDIIKEQKKLRGLLEKQRKENQFLRIELNQRIEACGKLSASFERLKKETNKPQDFEYDEFIIEEQMKGEIE
jgi:chromosome segregation ATPase